MLYIPPWQRSLIFVVCLLGLFFAALNLVPARMIEHWPSYVPKKQVSLGLDLRGGSYLLYEVDMKAAETDELNNLVDELRTDLVAQKIGYTGLAVDNDHVALVLREPGPQTICARSWRRSVPAWC